MKHISKRYALLVFSFFLFCGIARAQFEAQTYNVRTIAGGTSKVSLSSPHDVAADKSGNVYVVNGGKVLKLLAQNGTYSEVVIAGGGGGTIPSAPTLSDGTSVLLSGTITGIAVDASSNVYLCESSSENCIYAALIQPDGKYKITKIAGTGTSTYDKYQEGGSALSNNIKPIDLEVDAAGNLYVIGQDRVKQMKPETLGSTKYINVTTIAGLVEPSNGVADDYDPSYIQMPSLGFTFKNLTGIVISTVTANNGYPSKIFLTSNQTDPLVYVLNYDSDFSDYYIDHVAGLGSGLTTTFTGKGVDAKLTNPYGLTVDSKGSLYFSNGDHTIRKLTPNSDGSFNISTLAGSTSGYVDNILAANSKFFQPQGMAVCTGTIFVADFSNNALRMLLPNPIITSSLGKFDVCATQNLSISADNKSASAFTSVWRNYTNNTSFVATQTTCYWVDVTYTPGTFTTSLSVTLTVTPAPVTTATTIDLCSGQSSILSVLMDGSFTVLWSNGGTTISKTVTITTVGSSSYYATVTAACGSLKTNIVTITTKAIPSVAINSSVSAACKGTSFTLSLATSDASTTYAWSTGATSTSVVIQENAAGAINYSVVATNTNNCSASSSVTIQVYALPTVTIQTSLPNLCYGQSENLTASGASTYLWTNASNTNLGTAAILAIAPTVTTVYIVSGTDNHNCVSSAIVTVIVNPLPIVSFVASIYTICQGTSTNFTIEGLTSYTVSGPNLDASKTSATPTATSRYTLSGTDVNGCAGGSYFTITVNTSPSFTITSTTVDLCPGGAVTLEVEYSTTQGAVLIWEDGTWVENRLVAPVATTIYTLMGTVGGICTKTENYTITMHDAPTITILAPTQTICYGNTLVAEAQGNVISYDWGEGLLTAIVSLSPATTKTYIVTGSINADCKTTTTFTVYVNPLPTVGVTASSTSMCAGETASLTASGNATSYAWNNGATQEHITEVLNQSYTYIVTGTDNNGCEKSASKTIDVNFFPDFVISYNVARVCTGVPVDFQATNIVGASLTYKWMGKTSNNTNKYTAIPASVSETVYTLEVSNICGVLVKSVTLVVDKTPSVTVEGVPLGVLPRDAYVALSASSDMDVDFYWSNGIVNGFSFKPSKTENIYVVEAVAKDSGCIGVQTVTVFVEASILADFSRKDLIADRVFDMSLDNAVFRLKALEESAGLFCKEIKIFSNAGVVYEKMNYVNGEWDFTHIKTGNRLIGGAGTTYYYIMNLADSKNNELQVQGYFTLVK